MAFRFLQQNGVANPFLKQSFFVDICQKGANRNFECHCNQQTINRGMSSAFKCLRFLAFALKTDRFQNAPFSNLYISISAFEKIRFYGMSGRVAKIVLRGEWLDG